ncbi:MAG: rRNA adenine N-6-methyltransferase family protein, partial [Archaeoglobaceae archaeon]
MVVDKALIRRIVDYAELKSDDIALEVGCGTGNLTGAMLERCKVIGIEKDKKFVRLLEDKFKEQIDS